MSLTPIGAVAILFAGYALTCCPGGTYYAGVFFMGFSGCALVNVGGSFGLALSLFFFLCYAAALSWGRDSGRMVAWTREQMAPLCLTVLLALTLLASLCLPALRGELRPISVSVSVFTAAGLIVMWLTVAFVHSEQRLLTVLRLEFASVVFIAAWGGLQLACALLHLPYPSSIFNNSASHFALQYGAELGGGYVRIGSVAVEPSILVQSVGIPLSIAATLLYMGVAELRRWAAATVAAGAFAILFSTSTTGYFGVLTLLALLLVERPQRMFMLIPPLALGAAATTLLVPGLADAIIETTFTKSQSWSFTHRFGSISSGLDAFMGNPIIGAGAGTEQAKSLPVFLLANVGLIGTIVFGALMANLVAGLIAVRRRLSVQTGPGRTDPARLRIVLCLGLLNALVVSLAMQSVAGATYAFPDFWVLLGLIVATQRAIAPERISIAVPPKRWLRPLDAAQHQQREAI